MPVLILEDACLAYGHWALLDKANLQLDLGERVGLIGRNGAGKSSLMKVLASTSVLDDGVCRLIGDARLAYVPQEPALRDDATIFEVVAEGLGDAQRYLLAYHDALHAIETDHSDEAMTRLQDAQADLDHCDGWRVQYMVESALTQLGLDADALISSLSGGWKKRVALARALVAEPEVLLLDEPTNHLDIEAIEWLENLLLGFRGSVLLITHDRHFLDKVSTRIVELDLGKLTSFAGNFSAYQVKKVELVAIELDKQQKFDKVLAQEEVWVRQGIKARGVRNEGRVRRLEALRLERSQRRERLGDVNFAVAAGERSGKLVAELDKVSFAYDGRAPAVVNFSARLLRGDKIGLLGANGVGKTTLLRLILGQLTPTEGTVEQGTKLEIAYFDQFRETLNENDTLSDTISQGNDFIEINGQRKHVISYLEDFLFAPARARSPVSSLSGGERNRLLLARLFSRPANVLVLDEPTNDLDIETLELLEQLLQEYTGTVFLVSHDRTFLDNVVTQVISFEGNGVWRESAGGYRDWLAAKSRAQKAATQQAASHKVAASPKNSTTAAPSSPSKKTEPSRIKLSFQENRELSELPDAIAQLESEQNALNAQLADGQWFVRDLRAATAASSRVVEIDDLLLAKMARWEALEQKQSGGQLT